MYADDAAMWTDDLDEFEQDAEELELDAMELADAFRDVLHPYYAAGDSEGVEDALARILEKLPADEGLNFEKALRQIAQGAQKALRDPTVARIAGTALPAAGAALGTVVGGPVGTAIGGKLGSVAAGAFTGGRSPSPQRAAAQAAQVPVSGTPPGPQQGSAAAAQLLQLTQNPDVLKSLASLALGSLGRSSIRVGSAGQSVPVGAFMNLLGTLANQAAADADQLMGESDAVPSYLDDTEASFGSDPLAPEDRARMLYQKLAAAQQERLLDAQERLFEASQAFEDE
jgi:hypothetical protein